jgi:hypothetical protein
MKKKNILLIILCALILSPLIFAIGDGKSITSYEQAFQIYTIKAKQSNETDYVIGPKELLTVKEFLDFGEIHTVEVYYTSWSSHFHSYPPPSEEAFRYNEFETKSIIKCACTMVEFSNIRKALAEITLVPMQIVHPDYRLAFVAKDGNGRELTISFVHNAPVMSINGTQYRTDPKLVASVIDFLPHTSYDRIYKELVYSWYGRGLSYIQKNEQGKSN